MPSFLRRTIVRSGSKHLPLLRKVKIYGQGLYLHGQTMRHGGSIGSVLKSLATFFKGNLSKLLPFLKSKAKEYGPGIVKQGIEFAKNQVPGITDKIAAKVGAPKSVVDKIKKLQKHVGEKGSEKLEDEMNQLIRRFTGDGLSLHGQGIKKGRGLKRM